MTSMHFRARARSARQKIRALDGGPLPRYESAAPKARGSSYDPPVPKTTGENWMGTQEACEYLGIQVRTPLRLVTQAQ